VFENVPKTRKKTNKFENTSNLSGALSTLHLAYEHTEKTSIHSTTFITCINGAEKDAAVDKNVRVRAHVLWVDAKHCALAHTYTPTEQHG
jgi:hypothetical protein